MQRGWMYAVVLWLEAGVYGPGAEQANEMTALAPLWRLLGLLTGMAVYDTVCAMFSEPASADRGSVRDETCSSRQGGVVCGI